MSAFLQGAVIAAIGYIALLYFTKILPKANLQNSFVSLGNMTGMPLDDIVAKVGKPSGEVNHDDGSKSVAWSAGGYQIMLLFDKDGKCLKKEAEIL